MNHNSPPILFFSGTDTEVGKTFVAALATRLMVSFGMRVGVYKPAASGCSLVDGKCCSPDAEQLWQAANRPQTIDRVCPQRFLKPLAPPAAAAAEGRKVDISLLAAGARWWYSHCSLLIVEGAGGLFSPLGDGYTNADLAADLNATLVIVAENRLGVIHQVVATTLAAQHYGKERRLKIAGVVLNHPTSQTDPSTDSNLCELPRYCNVPVIGVVPYNGHCQPFEKWLRRAC